MLSTRVPRALIILPLTLCVFSSLPQILNADVADVVTQKISEVRAKKEKDAIEAADAKVAAAKTPFDKMVALYDRAGVPMDFSEPTLADWEKAGLALDEAFKILADLEGENKLKIENKHILYFRRGYVADKLENFKGAIRFYDSAEKEGYITANKGSDNKGSELYSNRGRAKAALYDFSGAIADYDKAIALKEERLWFQNRAWARFELGDYDGAVADWKRNVELGGINIEDDDDDFLDRRPDDKQNKEKPDAKPKEIKTPFDSDLIPFNKAIVANPKSATPIIERARYRIQQAKTNFVTDSIYSDILNAIFGDAGDDKTVETMRDALQDLDRAIDVEQKSAEAWRERGRTRALYMTLKNGQKDRGFAEDAPFRDLLKSLELDDKSAATRFELGEYFLNRKAPQTGTVLKEEDKTRRENDLRSAILNYSRAIYLSPDASGDAHFKRAYAERQLPSPDINTLLVDYEAVIAQDLKAIGEAPEKEKKDDALALAHTMRGRILGNAGQLSTAISEYDKAIALDADNFEARFERSKVRILRGEYDAALEDLNLITQKRPNFAEGWLWRAAARDGRGETTTAQSDLQEAFKRDAKLRERVRGTRYDEGAPNAQVALAPAPAKGDVKQIPPGIALEHKNAGNSLRQKGDDAGALAEYSAAILIDPNFADGYNNRASVYIEQKKYDLALADLNRAIDIDSKHCIAYYNRARLWGNLDEGEKQRADLDRAIEYADLPSRKVDAYIARAKARFAAKDQAGANSDFKMASEQAAQDANAWQQIAMAQFFIEQNAEAAVSLRRSLELKPESTLNRLYLAVALTFTNDTTAPGELERAIGAATPADLKEINDSVKFLLSRKPDSPVLKSLRDKLNKPNP